MLLDQIKKSPHIGTLVWKLGSTADFLVGFWAQMYYWIVCKIRKMRKGLISKKHSNCIRYMYYCNCIFKSIAMKSWIVISYKSCIVATFWCCLAHFLLYKEDIKREVLEQTGKKLWVKVLDDVEKCCSWNLHTMITLVASGGSFIIDNFFV